MNEEIIASVIVLTYNDYSNLSRNLSSIAAQTYQSIEVIIQDDHSQDYSYSVIEDIVKKSGLKSHYIISSNEKNLGTVKNANEAIKQSRGAIYIPLSQDDYFADDKAIETIMNEYKKTHFSESHNR